MNLLLLSHDDLIAQDQAPRHGLSRQRARVTGNALAHILTVHRAKVGDSLRVGLVNAGIGTGRIEALSPSEAILSLELNHPPPPPLNVTLLLSLPRPKYLARILTSVSSFGIKRIFLMHSFRVEKAYWSCEQIRPEEIRKACWKGLEQARDTVLPQVELRRRFKPFVEDEVPTLVASTQDGARALVAHPTGEFDCPAQLQGPLTLAIGPEGGFLPYEVQKLQEAGFECVRFGSRILNVEVAIPALLGRIAVLP